MTSPTWEEEQEEQEEEKERSQSDEQSGEGGEEKIMQGVGSGVGGVTRGRSMRTCMPSPGPMWATWLKLVGLEIILERSSGSLSISLTHTHTQVGVGGGVWGGGVQGVCVPAMTELL